MPTSTALSALLSRSTSVDGASFDSPPLDGPPLPPDELSAFLRKHYSVSFDTPPLDGPPLPPDEFSKYLWDNHRIQRSPRRLAQLRMSGEGPPYVRDGNVVRYPPRLGSIWAVEQLGAPVRSTSEESARKLIGQRDVPTPSHT